MNMVGQHVKATLTRSCSSLSGEGHCQSFSVRELPEANHMHCVLLSNIQASDLGRRDIFKKHCHRGWERDHCSGGGLELLPIGECSDHKTYTHLKG